jgi:hypothetical protein
MLLIDEWSWHLKKENELVSMILCLRTQLDGIYYAS